MTNFAIFANPQNIWRKLPALALVQQNKSTALKRSKKGVLYFWLNSLESLPEPLSRIYRFDDIET